MIADPVELTAEVFEGLKGETFSVGEGDEPLEFKLSAVRRLPGLGSKFRAPFALDFTGSARQPLGQGMFQFKHPALGSLAIFIVPIGESGKERRYEAIFG